MGGVLTNRWPDRKPPRAYSGLLTWHCPQLEWQTRQCLSMARTENAMDFGASLAGAFSDRRFHGFEGEMQAGGRRCQQSLRGSRRRLPPGPDRSDRERCPHARCANRDYRGCRHGTAGRESRRDRIPGKRALRKLSRTAPTEPAGRLTPRRWSRWTSKNSGRSASIFQQSLISFFTLV